jgi:DNA-binding MarR family transcriptional regulator
MRSVRSSTTRRAKDSDYRALAEFRYHIRKYLDFSDEAAKAAGMEPKQYQLLLAIRGLPQAVEPTISTLAEQVRGRHHSTVELVDRAEANGLVKRTRAGTRVFVQLTRKGDRVLARAVEQRLKELRVAGPLLVQALQQLIDGERTPGKKRR